MKRVLPVAFFLLAAAAHADDFRWSARIVLNGDDAFQRLRLPYEVYRDSKSLLADVRVVNARGEWVMTASVPPPPAERAPVDQMPLKSFRLTSQHKGGAVAGLDVRIKSGDTRAQVLLEERAPGKRTPEPKVVAYLLDAAPARFDIAALRFDWEAAPGAEVIRVTVEASDELRDWRPVATRAPLVRVSQDGEVLARTHVDLGGVRAKYLRVTWDGAPFVLRSVLAESKPSESPAAGRVVREAKAQRTKEGDLAFDLGAVLPVEAIRVVFPEADSLMAYEIFARHHPNATWRRVGAATLHRLTSEGGEQSSAPLEVGRISAREWRFQPRLKGPVAAGAPLPSLEAHWRPAELVFHAKGGAPYTLAWDDPDETSGAESRLADLVPGYVPGMERKLPIATVAEIRSHPTSTWRWLMFETDARRVMLWAVLILGVLVLGFIAWRLQSQMKAK